MKATNIVPVQNISQPFISFQADPRVATIFQQFGMLKADPKAGHNMWVLYPSRGKFEETYMFVLTYETE